MRSPVAVFGFLVIGLVALYAGAYGYPLVFDDDVVASPYIARFASGWPVLDSRWVAYSTFAVTKALAGMSVPVLRVQNVALHAATAFAIYLLCRSIVPPPAAPPHSTPRRGKRARKAVPQPATPDPALAALIATAIFAVHPATVYAVAYLVERSIIMATLFSVLSLLAWLRGAQERNARWLAASVALYFLAVFSKEHAVMLPAAAIALTLALRDTVRAPRAWLAATLAAQALVAILIVLELRGVIGAAYEPYVAEALRAPVAPAPSAAPPSAAAAPVAAAPPHLLSAVTQSYLFFKYLLLWLVPWPGWMAVDLREPLAASPLSLPQALGLVAFPAWGAAALYLMLARRAFAIAGFAMLFAWLMFLVEFSVVRAQEPFVLYRSYLWMTALPLALTWLAQRLPARAVLWGGAALCVALGFALRDRLNTFATPLALWDDAVRKQRDERLPLADRAIGNRGVALLQSGRYVEAMADFNRTLRLNPDNAHALVSRAAVHAQYGDIALARNDLDEAIRRSPALADAFAQRCGLRLNAGDGPGAIDDCNRALAIEPKLPSALLNRGVAFARQGELGRALSDFDTVLGLFPDLPLARMNRGNLLAQLGQPDRARADFEFACRAGAASACATLKGMR